MISGIPRKAVPLERAVPRKTKYSGESMYSCRKCLSEIGLHRAPTPRSLHMLRVSRTDGSSEYRRIQISRGTMDSRSADKRAGRHMQTARCYCNAIQSLVTIGLVVWLHNPICQAIGYRRVAVRVIPAGCCRFLTAAVRVGSRDLETRRFSGS